MKSPSVLAVGAWLKNCACVVVRGEARWSALHGDLSDPAACAALGASVRQLLEHARQAGAPVQAVAHDLHPDFFSTQLAREIAQELDVPAVAVQHHHAHLAAVVAEHGLTGSVLGLALDGVGLGTDGTPWGGELLGLSGPRCRRLGHLQPLALPGGDRAAREPWRMAASALHAMGCGDTIVARLGPHVGEVAAMGVRQMLDRRLNSPQSSSAGRWFDAAAGLLGLCGQQDDEAQAAVMLEHAAARALAQQPGLQPTTAARQHADGCVDLRPVLEAMLQMPDRDAAAAVFHLGLADGLATALVGQARALGVQQAVLGGGCFFNRILRERVVRRLQDAGLSVHLPGPRGCGDAGLAIGQAWVAARQLGAALPARWTEESLRCA